MTDLTLVLGGAASGKSLFAERLITDSGHKRHYIATAQAFDKEMREKIARHRERRHSQWKTTESPLDPGAVIAMAEADEALLLDCATLWLSNVILANGDVDAAVKGLLYAIEQRGSPLVVVSNEVGMGVVPEHRLGRDFRNAQGMLNQRLAELADTVVFVIAGLPVVLKGALQ